MKAILPVLLGLMSVFASAHAQAPTEAPLALSIQQQTLRNALNEWAQQTGYQLISEIKGEFVAPGVKGMLTPQAALEKLLEGSGLTYEFIGARTVAVREKTVSNRQSSSSLLRIVQASQAPQAGAIGETKEAADETDTKGIPEVLVKGSRMLNMDIKRTRDDVQPYVIFDRAVIERSGATNLEDFFKTRLPMNTNQRDSSQIAGQGAIRGNQSSINLRGLGANQTLILVDGRRMAGVYTTAVEQPDINGISLASIERIEVLPSTASGIYGGSATGGVINIILRRDYTGVETKLTYENTTDSDAAVRKVDIHAGFNLEGGKTQVLLSGSYSDANPLRVQERDFVQRGRALMLANNQNNYFVFNAANPPRGATSNILGVGGANLQFKPALGGTNLNSSFTYIPNGYAGTAAQLPALAANAGRFNIELPNDYSSLKSVYLAHPQIQSASLNLRRPFGARVQAFLDASLIENHSIASSVGGGAVTLPASAPNNPFTTAIRVTYPVTSLDGEFDSDTFQRRAAGGVIVQLPRQWTAGADYTWNRSIKTYASWVAMTAAGNAALADGTLDVMRDLNVYPLQYLPQHLNPRDNSAGGPWRYTVRNASLRLAGPLLPMPGGPIALSALLERREEGLAATTNIDTTGASTFYPARTQNVNSAYVEARLPLVSSRNALPAIRELEGQLSVRRDEYETNGVTDTVSGTALSSFVRETNKANSTDITVGLRYSPLQDAVLRVSYGTGFLPPSLTQIIPALPFSGTIIDSRRGGASTTIQIQSGGNPDLAPEESRSWSAGVVLTPRVLPDLRLSIDYTRIEKDNEISNLNSSQLIDLETVLVGRVTRAASCPGDPYAPICPVLATDSRAVNISQSRLDAYDVQFDYRRADLGGFGAVDFFGIATWQTHLLRRFAPNADFVENVGFDSGVLRFKGNAGFTWQLGRWTAGWTTRYIDSYRVYTATATALTIATAVRNQGSDTIPDRYYHDAFAQYRFGRHPGRLGWLSDAEMGLSVKNVFNTDPPILAVSAWFAGGYSTYGDPRLRMYSLSLKKSFQ